MKFFQETQLEKQVSGSLRSTIKAHGPIDGDLIGSAAKRVATAIRAQALNELEGILEEGPNLVVKRYQRENEDLVKRNRVLSGTADYWRRLANMEVAVVKAHDFSKHNRDLLEASETCACFYCLANYKPEEIKEWIGEEDTETALCPHCGIDSVIGDKSGFRLTPRFIALMSSYWFSGEDGKTADADEKRAFGGKETQNDSD